MDISLLLNNDKIMNKEKKSVVDLTALDEYVNDHTTGESYRWQSDGRKLITSQSETCWRFYYRCGNWKATGCRARRNILEMSEGSQISYKIPHNHSPPPPKIDTQVKQLAEIQLSSGAKPSLLHKKIVLNAPNPGSRKHVPTMQQLYNWKYQASVKELPGRKF